MGQALYRKHRSRKLSEIVGQEHITKTLDQALKQGRISHAYLLTGPRGVGKTSVARILAHEINGLPYKDDTAHIDIIEIDAASNRRIDEIRELREKVYVAPAQAKYKVYIIDEVHMLTREAFNALLKTLEEPPEHVIFILATTDVHKLPETIISRTQRFTFKPADKDKTVALLSDIAKQEKIKINPGALELLAEHGGGSFRDSVSMLDQVSSRGPKVELADVQRQLGLPPAEAVDKLISLLAQSTDAAALMQTLNQLYDQGYQAAAIAKQLGQALRYQLANGEMQLDYQSTLALLGKLITVPASPEPGSLLEIILLSNLKPSEVKVVSSKPEQLKKASESPKKSAVKEKKEAKLLLDDKIWTEVLAALKQKHNTIYSVARMAKPHLEDGVLQLTFSFAFHQKRFNEANNRQLLVDTIHELTGQSISIESIVDESSEVEPRAATANSEDLSAISNIFGGGELLES